MDERRVNWKPLLPVFLQGLLKDLRAFISGGEQWLEEEFGLRLFKSQLMLFL